jgi:hypothetical protein
LSSGTAFTTNAGTTAVFQRNATTGNGCGVAIIGGNAGSSFIDFGDADSQTAGQIAYDHGSNFMAFNTNSAERMRITSAGNVGIGTSSPGTTKLFVQTDGSAVDTLTVYSPSTGNGAVIRLQDNNFSATISSVPAGGTTNLAFGVAGAERMRIAGDGKVLIGAISTASNLSVLGNSGTTITAANNFSTGQAFLSTNTAAAGAGWFHFNGVSNNNTVQNILILGNGNIQNANNSYGTFSDIKLKENIVDTTPKLDDVLKLKVRNFNLIGEQENQKQIGFIAQEMEEVFPKLVDESIGIDGEPVKGIKTSVLIPILVKAIQELKAEVDALKAQINQ